MRHLPRAAPSARRPHADRLAHRLLVRPPALGHSRPGPLLRYDRARCAAEPLLLRHVAGRRVHPGRLCARRDADLGPRLLDRHPLRRHAGQSKLTDKPAACRSPTLTCALAACRSLPSLSSSSRPCSTSSAAGERERRSSYFATDGADVDLAFACDSYAKIARDFRRLDNLSLSPLYGLFAEVIGGGGLAVIRSRVSIRASTSGSPGL